MRYSVNLMILCLLLKGSVRAGTNLFLEGASIVLGNTTNGCGKNNHA